MWSIFRSKEKKEATAELREDPRVDFDKTLEEMENLSPRAQATFCYRLVEVLPNKVLKSLIYYATRKLGGKNNMRRQEEYYTGRSM